MSEERPEQAETGAEESVDRSLAALLARLAGEAETLVLQQLALARAELREGMTTLSGSSLVLLAGLLIAFAGLLALVAAAALALAKLVEPWLACVIVGVTVLALGLLLVVLARRRIAASGLALPRTLRSLAETEAWLRDEIR